MYVYEQKALSSLASSGAEVHRYFGVGSSFRRVGSEQIRDTQSSSVCESFDNLPRDGCYV